MKTIAVIIHMRLQCLLRYVKEALIAGFVYSKEKTTNYLGLVNLTTESRA